MPSSNSMKILLSINDLNNAVISLSVFGIIDDRVLKGNITYDKVNLARIRLNYLIKVIKDELFILND